MFKWLNRLYARLILKMAMPTTTGHYEPVPDGFGYTCECIDCTDEFGHWHIYVNGIELGIHATNDEDDDRYVVLPPGLKLCRWVEVDGNEALLPYVGSNAHGDTAYSTHLRNDGVLPLRAS